MIDALVLAQTILTGGLAAWMLTGVYDNWRHPALNKGAVAMVLGLELMAAEYPDDYEHIKYRRIDNPRTIRNVFYLLVLSETVAATALVIGTGLMIAGIFGVVPLEFARGSAMIGAMLFCTNWIGFLVGGNYFVYWYCHFGAQATHFLLLLWGLGVIILLALE